MTNWEKIHEGFSKKNLDNKTYQQLWEESNLTYQDAQEWISIGLKPDGLYYVEQWKNHNFTIQQTKSWRNIGLKPKDYEFSAYLKRIREAL